MTILAIDPGNTESGWVVLDTDTYRPVEFGKDPNYQLRQWMVHGDRGMAYVSWTYIEMVASYGMSVGAEVFDTCVWIGRFVEVAPAAGDASLVYRRDVKLHHCEDSRAKDGNIAQALVDRFAPGQKNHGKGTKAQPGWFHGFKKDIWQAYALAVYAADTQYSDTE